jgi:sulfur carrier protein
MKITVNGEAHEVSATSLANVLEELGYGGAIVATALNGTFLPRSQRSAVPLREGDCLEIVAPMQGG